MRAAGPGRHPPLRGLPVGALAAGAARRGRACPSIVRTVHHVDDFASPVLAECQRASIEDVDHRVCVSRHWAERAARATTASRPRSIPNGVDGARFADCPLDRAGGRAAAGLGRPARRCWRSAASSRARAAATLLEAFARARGRIGAGALLAIAGRRDAVRLRRLPRRLGARTPTALGLRGPPRAPPPPAGRRRRGARPDPRRRHAGPLPRGRRVRLPLRAGGLRPRGARGAGGGPAGRGQRPPRAARVPRGRPRLP